MAAEPYRVSFTTGGLYYREAIKALEIYFVSQDWQTTRSRILMDNVFQSRTRASTGRILRELLPRLAELSKEQLELLSRGTRQEQNQLLWLAVCKRYRLIREFAVEVLHEKWLRLDTTLSYLDFDAFFNAKAEWHEELAALTEMTRKKLRRVLFQMLREAEILSARNQILPMAPTPRIARLMLQEDGGPYAVFPITEADLKRQAAV